MKLIKALLFTGAVALVSSPFVAAEASHWLQARRLAALQDNLSSLASLWVTYALGDPNFNPTGDSGAVDCRQNQPSPHNVTVLTGSFGGTTTRSCRVPPRTPIFIPVLNCGFLDGETGVPCSTDDDCAFIPGTCLESGFCRTQLSTQTKVDICEGQLENSCNMRVLVDGQQVYPTSGGLPLLRGSSDPTAAYAVAFGGTVADFDPNSIASGHWALIPGFRRGPHTVQVQGSTFDANGVCGGPGAFGLDVTYELDVRRSHH